MENDVLLEFQEKTSWILDHFFDGLEERDRFATVDDAMIIGQGQVHHRANHNLTVEPQRDALGWSASRGSHSEVD